MINTHKFTKAILRLYLLKLYLPNSISRMILDHMFSILCSYRAALGLDNGKCSWGTTCIDVFHTHTYLNDKPGISPTLTCSLHYS